MLMNQNSHSTIVSYVQVLLKSNKLSPGEDENITYIDGQSVTVFTYNHLKWSLEFDCQMNILSYLEYIWMSIDRYGRSETIIITR